MKKKILCGALFLMILFCISFSQTHLTAAGLPGAAPAPGSLGTDSASGTAPDAEPEALSEVSEDASLSGENAGSPGEDIALSGENAGSSGENLGSPGESLGSPGESLGPSGEAAGLSGEDIALSDETSSAAPDSQPPAVMDGAQVASGALPGLPSASTPEPLENKAAADGEYTLSLTTSIGTLTYYNQSDSRWANYLYGGADPLAVYGCGPTVLAMLVTSFTEHTCQPPDMAAWAAANHYWSLGYGTKHEFIPEGAAAFGLHAESFRDFTPEGVISELKSGHILVALMGPGHFSDSGHFIIITDDWSGNQVRVADPARLERTQAAWDVEIILNELLATATGGGPVWSITPK